MKIYKLRLFVRKGAINVCVKHSYQKSPSSVFNSPDILSGRIEFFLEIAKFYQTMPICWVLMLLPANVQGLLLLSWINFNPTMDK